MILMERKKKILMLSTAVAAIVVAAAVWAFDPMQAPWMPKCMIHELTGLSCPGCGFTRALHSLLHGHPLEAVRYNLFLLLAIPYILALVGLQTVPALRGNTRLVRALTGPAAIYTYLILLCCWGIVRNVIGI